MTDLWFFSLGALALLASPGPTNALLAMGGAQGGFVRGLPLLVAELLGYSAAILIIHIVLLPVLTPFPAVAAGLKVAFALYTAWLAARLWRHAARPLTSDRPVGFATLFTGTLLNPKAFGFALVLIPFESPDLPLFIAAFAGLVVLSGGGWLCAGALAARYGGAKGQSAVGRLASVVMAIFSALILVSVLRA